MAALGRLLLGLLIVGVIFIAAAWVIRTDLIYPFGPDDTPPKDPTLFQIRSIPAHGDDPELTVWLVPPVGGRPVVVYFMGLDGTLAAHEPRLTVLAQAGYGIAAMAYRGGGGQAGSPSEAALMKDARRLYTALDGLIGEEVRDTSRVIWGFSLGAGIASRLAAEQEELLLVLEAPAPRLCDMDHSFFKFLPGCFFFRDHAYNTIDHIAQAGAPVLLLYGDNDPLVAPGLADAIFDAAAEPRFRKVYEGGGHTDLGKFGVARDAMAFIRTIRGVR